MDPQPTSLSKEEKQLNKQLNHHLDRYSSLRDWSELALWLTKLRTMLSDYKVTIINKTTLLKKLSTSLNPSLPAALHQSTLQIYELMLSKFIVVSNLQFVCLGLFSFYNAANVKCRIKVCEMFKFYLPKFGKDIQMLATGILITVLPSLTEMHEGMVKQVNELLEVLSSNSVIGQEVFIQSIWIALLRSSSCRIAGLKFISTKLGKLEDIIDNQDEDDENYWNQTIEQPAFKQTMQMSQESEEKDIKKVDVSEYCPHIDTLVTNTLIACIQDSNILVTKIALDFLYKYLPLKTELLPENCKMKLAHSIIWLLSKRDIGVTRKINLWLFGKLDSENKFIINQLNLNFIIEPLINFLTHDSNLEPLKIIFNLYNEHEDLPSLTMPHLAKQILDFCRRQENQTEAIKLVQRLLDKIHYQLPVLSKALGQGLLEEIEKNQYREADQILQLTTYLLQKIIRTNERKIIILDLLKTIMESYQRTQWKDRQFMKNSLTLTQNILETGLEKGEAEQGEQVQITRNIDTLTSLLDILSEKNQENYEHESYLICKVQVRLNQIFDIYPQRWVTELIRMAFLKQPNYYLTAIEVIGDGLEKEGKLKTELLLRGQSQKNNEIKICISKLWSILSLRHLHVRVIPLLLKLVKYFPAFFESVLENDFTHTEMAITKFSLFWQISPKYPSIISHQHLAQICKVGFFKMLSFLDEGNPLVKYNTKIWINECFPNFNRVLDPLLEIVLQPNGCWYQTMKGEHVFTIPPDKQKVISCMKYLNSIIKHTVQKFFKFASKPLTLHIRPYYEFFITKQVLQGVEKEENAEVCYLRVIFDVLVRFMTTKYVNQSNYQDSDALNLICCDVLETILKQLKDHQMCLKFVENHFHNILNGLHFATANCDHILQIQFLNIIDCIFFHSVLRNSNNVKKLRVMVSDPVFTRTILEGLNTEFPYIKQRFVDFINKSIPLFLEYHNSCSELISQILNNYSSKIMLVHSHKLESDQSKDIEISKKNSEILILLGGVTELLSYFLNLSIKPFEKQKNQSEPDSGFFSLYTWKSYVSLNIERKVIESSKARRNAEQISKHIPMQLEQLLLTITTCWSPSQLVSHYKISQEGLSEYDFDEFKAFNDDLCKMLGSKYETSESVESFIINFVRVLINKYPREIMNAFIKNWASANTVEYKIKLIQILNMSSIPIDIFYTNLAETIIIEHKKKKNDSLIFVKSLQSDILQFAQFYTHYSFQNITSFQTMNYLNIWIAFFRFIRIFEHSNNILTLFAFIQLVQLFTSKYYSKEIIRQEKLRKEFQLLTNAFHELVQICSRKISIKCMIEGQITLQSFLPLPTSVFEVYLSELGKVEDAKVSYMLFNTMSPTKSVEYLRIYAFIILKRVGFIFLKSFYYQSEASLVKKAREVFTHILSVVENKKENNLNIDWASEVAISLMKCKQTFARELKYDVLQIFNKDDFFICSSKTLHCWAKIIDNIVDNNKDHDIFTEYLDKVSLASSFFTGYGTQTKKKIKSFQRICFILFAGRKDKYIDKTHLLIDKIIEVIKNAEAPPPVLILIFFCIRILILRTSPDKLTKLLANLWQLIMFLLANIFKQLQFNSQDKKQLNLIWAALKLIQMVSIMELNEFNPHQWIFFYDFIGLKFTTNPNNSTEQILNQNIRPLIAKYLPDNVIAVKGEIQQTPQIGHLIIKEDKIDDIDLLKTKALLLSSYLIRNNQCKMKFNIQEIEDLIENDFLNLDDFIFKFK